MININGVYPSFFLVSYHFAFNPSMPRDRFMLLGDGNSGVWAGSQREQTGNRLSTSRDIHNVMRMLIDLNPSETVSDKCTNQKYC